MEQRTFNRIKQIHLSEYLPLAIGKFGHAILHGDGNIHVDREFDEYGNPMQKEHQRSFLAKKFAGVGNEAASYRIKFTSVDELPETLEELEKMLLDAKAKEAFDDGKLKLSDNFLSIGGAESKKTNALAEENAALKAEIEELKKAKQPDTSKEVKKVVKPDTSKEAPETKEQN